MGTYVLGAETRARLMTVSTATLCTALFKRGLRNQFVQDVRPVSEKGGIWSGRPSRCAISRRVKT